MIHLDSLLVMLTLENLGRYAIPIRPLIHDGYGLAIAKFLARVFPVREREETDLGH